MKMSDALAARLERIRTEVLSAEICLKDGRLFDVMEHLEAIEVMLEKLK